MNIVELAPASPWTVETDSIVTAVQFNEAGQYDLVSQAPTLQQKFGTGQLDAIATAPKTGTGIIYNLKFKLRKGSKVYANNNSGGTLQVFLYLDEMEEEE